MIAALKIRAYLPDPTQDWMGFASFNQQPACAWEYPVRNRPVELPLWTRGR